MAKNEDPILNNAGRYLCSGLQPGFARFSYEDELSFGVGHMENLRDFLTVLEKRIEDSSGESQRLIRDLRRDVAMAADRCYELLRRLDLVKAEKGEL